MSSRTIISQLVEDGNTPSADKIIRAGTIALEQLTPESTRLVDRLMDQLDDEVRNSGQAHYDIPDETMVYAFKCALAVECRKLVLIAADVIFWANNSDEISAEFSRVLTVDGESNAVGRISVEREDGLLDVTSTVELVPDAP